MDTTVFLDFSLLQIILQKTFLNIHLGTHTMSATYLAHIYPEYKYAQDKLWEVESTAKGENWINGFKSSSEEVTSI